MIQFLEKLTFKSYTLQNKPPSLSISMKGRIDIKRTACEMLGLQHGDMVNFAYDPDKNIYYIYKCSKEMIGYKVIKEKKSGSMVFCCKAITEKIFKDYALYVIDSITQSKLIDPNFITEKGLKLYRIKQTDKDIKV